MQVRKKVSEMKSFLIATLQGKQYPNEWMSELRTTLQTDSVAGYRDLRWYSQPKQRDGDVVGVGTHVVLKDPKVSGRAEIIGTVVEREILSPQHDGIPSTNKLLVEVWKTPILVVKADGDPYVHKTLCDRLGIPWRGGLARGIYCTEG